jgi:hypothetical protein
VFGWIAGAVVLQNLICNAFAIPRWGASGAAAVALSSSILMAGLTVAFAARLAGGLPVLRTFSGPAVACAVLALVASGLPLPAIPAALVALAAYGAALAMVELGAYREDVLAFARVLPRWGRPTSAVE